MVVTRKRAAGSPISSGNISGSQSIPPTPSACLLISSATSGSARSTPSSNASALVSMDTSLATSYMNADINTTPPSSQINAGVLTTSAGADLPAPSSSASSNISVDVCSTKYTSTGLLLTPQASDVATLGIDSQTPSSGVISVASNSQTEVSSTILQTDASKDITQLNPGSEFEGCTHSESESVVPSSLSDTKTVGGSTDSDNGEATSSFTLPVVLSPASGVGEAELPLPGRICKSQLQVVSSPTVAPGQPQQVRYKVVYNTVSPASLPSAQQPGTASTINVSPTGLFSSSLSTSPAVPSNANLSAAASVPSAYTIIATSPNKSSNVRHIFVPVSRSVSAQGGPVTSLLASASSTRPASKPARSMLNLSGSILADLAIPSQSVPIPKPVAWGGTATAGIVPASPASTSQLVSSSLPVKLVSASSATPKFVPRTMVSVVNLSAPTLTSPSTVAAISSSTAQDVMASSLMSAVQESPTSRPEEKEATMMWDKNSTLMLIELYKDHKAFFESKHYKKKSVWEQIAVKLRQGRKGSPKFCWNHVENKWKNMTKKYRDCIDMNRRNGTNHRCRFQDEIAAVYSYNPDGDQKAAGEGFLSPEAGQNGNAVEGNIFLSGYAGPVNAGMTNTLFLPTKREKPSTDDEIVGGGDGHDAGMFLVKKKKYLKLDTQFGQTAPKPILPQPSPTQLNLVQNNSDNDIVSLLQQLREDRIGHERTRMDRLEAMHREKMNMFGKFLDILKQSKQS